MAKLLETAGLTLTLGGRGILNGIELAVEKGELHVLLGANGAGKSSLAYALMGCAGYRPQAGHIVFDGEDITALPLHERARRGLALAWQEPARFDGLTVADYLVLGGKRPSADCLVQVGLAPQAYLSRPLDKALSGGERKRIELAGVLALSPRLAILDEPTAGIDFLSQTEIEGVIRTLRHQGAVLLITHQEALAAGADRASQLCGGRIVCAGAPGAVIENFKARRCRRCDGETCHG
ncbi:iron-regulated ABC transporter ATPase subunit SufC [Sulfuritortus calidifontis]|uniref:Iron-regulated ABC transporter ATPase subunit SufC n=1 Tax=Sulfuritortus calidifontis TaxID=1914471 RepID=A0A4R3JV64_9PROT|nr:ATP-binding cassette domain-containing protein [Sulfuritortus calidifontis]TCS71749.1 iron-regulated ABC transporter ATPase subunit SufC [Sulfuritortus calidifontis]